MILESVLTLLSLGGQTATPANVTEELTRLEQQIADTYKRGRCDEWAAFLAPEWSVIHITGATIAKEEAVASCRNLPAPLDALSHEVVSVRSYGDFAVLTGRTTATTGGAESMTVTLRFTDVFVRRNGRWQVVASQATRIAP